MKSPVNEFGSPVPCAYIESKVPDITCWLDIYYPQDDSGLLKAITRKLAAVGWHPQAYKPPPPIDGVAQAGFTSIGSALFCGWTPAEAKRKLSVLKMALRSQKLPIYRRKLTLADMI